MRHPFIAGNWKMFKTVQDTRRVREGIPSLVKDIEDVEIVIAPPFTAVRGRRGGEELEHRRSRAEPPLGA